MIGVGAHYVSKWLWGGKGGPADFSIMAPHACKDNGKRGKTRKPHCFIDSQTKHVSWRIVGQYKIVLKRSRLFSIDVWNQGCMAL